MLELNIMPKNTIFLLLLMKYYQVVKILKRTEPQAKFRFGARTYTYSTSYTVRKYTSNNYIEYLVLSLQLL